MNFDVVVIGLGANGSSAMYHLSKTGYKVCGIDRFTPLQTHGSSTGKVALSGKRIMKARCMYCL